jgi:hypothetical protein
MMSDKNEGTPDDISQPIYHGLIAGGCAAVVSRVFTLPPDTVKARLQVSSGMYKGTVDAFVKIGEREGVRGFYRGFGALLVTVVPANMCYFGGYELGKRLTPSDWGPGSDVITAIFAQSLAGVAYCPIDIVKQTVQTAEIMPGGGTTANRTNPWEASKRIWHAQGIKGFYRGFFAMNALWMPWNLIYLTLYEGSKRKAYEWRLRDLKNRGLAPQSGRYVRGSHGDSEVEVYEVSPHALAEVLPSWIYPVCSSMSAGVAAVATHPIDVIKTRLQVQSSLTGKRQMASVIIRDLWQNHGLSGFSKGLGARVVTMCVGTSISWLTYESTKKKLVNM